MEANSRSATLIREAAESVSAVDDPRTRLAQQVGYLQGIVRSLCAEYAGDGAKPQSGCNFFTATAGDASVLLEYEYQRAEAANHNPDSPTCGPGREASVSIIQALVNGAWCDPADVFSESLIERWAEQIDQSESEQAAAAREPDERSRYDDRIDFAEAA